MAFMLHQYIHGIYHVYTRHILVYATDIACTSCCFQGFMALIAHPRCRDSCSICLLAMMNREDLHLRNLVRFHFNGYAYHILCICLVYDMYIHCISYVYVNDITGILRVYTPYSMFCREN